MRMGKPYDLVFTTKIVAVLTFLFTGRKKSVFLYTFALSKDGSFAQGGMGEMNEDVSPKYVCKVLRVDNLLIKPNIVKDYAMHYE